MNLCQLYLGLNVDRLTLVYDEAQDNLLQMNVGAPRLKCQLVHRIQYMDSRGVFSVLVLDYLRTDLPFWTFQRVGEGEFGGPPPEKCLKTIIL